MAITKAFKMSQGGLGSEILIDADGDTSITADTDDQIDIKIAGADDFKFTANAFNILSGSTLTIDSGATITNSGTANGFGLTASASIGTSDNSNGYILFDNTLLINWVRKSSTATQTISWPLAFTNYYGVYHGTETSGGAYLRIHSFDGSGVTVGSGGANVTGWVLAIGRKT